MKTFIYITIFIFTITSCKQSDKSKSILVTEEKWSPERIKQYFIDSIALRHGNGKFGQGGGLNDFDSFSKYFFTEIKAKNIEDPLIFAFDENYIDTTQVEKSIDWLRITVDPCFDIPYCLVLEKVQHKAKLTIKITNGYGCYYSGYLNFINNQVETDTIYSSVLKRLNTIDFWKLADDRTCGNILDGERWTFEAITNGKYNLVNRHSPELCKSTETQTLLSIANDLKKLSKLNDFLALKMQMNKKILGED